MNTSENIKLNLKVSQKIQQWGYDKVQTNRKGALRDWTPEIARQIKDVFDNDLERLISDKYFLGLREAKENVMGDDVIYPCHREDILAIYEENKKRPITLVILIEGIGSGKSTVYSIMTWLEWMRLICKYDPHRYYGILKDEIIAFIAMNRSEKQAKRVTLQKVLPKFQTQFNLEYFPPNKRRGQEIWIPRNNTMVFAGTSSAASALGYNVYGGGVDEANFLEVIEGGKRTQSIAETYDAAEEMHNAMFNRMSSRFLNPTTGRQDGMLFMISSSRYPDDFLERKAREHFQLGEKSHIFVRRRTLWEAKPKWYFSGVKVPFDLKEKKIIATDDEISKLREQGEAVQQERTRNRALGEKAMAL